MLRIFCLVISVAIEIIGEKSYSLHIGESFGGIGEELYLKRVEETSCAFKVSFGELPEHIHIELHIGSVRIIFLAGVCGCAQEVSEVREYERRHHCIKIDHAYHIAFLIE